MIGFCRTLEESLLIRFVMSNESARFLAIHVTSVNDASLAINDLATKKSIRRCRLRKTQEQ